MKMKLKKILFVGIIAISMVAFTACGGAKDGETPEGTNDTPITSETPDAPTDAIPGENADEPATGEQEVAVSKDGTYPGTGTTADGKGEIEIELIIADAKIQDMKVVKQNGIELDEATVESFKTALVNSPSIEEVSLEEVTGEESEISILLDATYAAIMQSLIG